MTPPSPYPFLSISALPSLSAAQMREVDRLMEAEYGIALLQMMENAGRNLADLAQTMLGGEIADRPVLTLCGRGANGGGGLVAARHLANRGADIQVITPYPFDTFAGVPARQLQTLLAMGVSVSLSGDGWELPAADLALDALIGYGLRGNPRGEMADLIRLANSHPAPILSLDTPSGLDAATGQAYDPVIRPAATMTLALPKQGLLAAPQTAVGDLYLADISVPPQLYQAIGFDVPPLFANSSILYLQRVVDPS
ncbi:MAG: NAD(P)H-hydrate epimerase [Caldilineales bacterium]|nr:NAD(P)H-hydrate epimerase [Caldilineales bacterium]